MYPVKGPDQTFVHQSGSAEFGLLDRGHRLLHVCHQLGVVKNALDSETGSSGWDAHARIDFCISSVTCETSPLIGPNDRTCFQGRFPLAVNCNICGITLHKT